MKQTKHRDKILIIGIVVGLLLLTNFISPLTSASYPVYQLLSDYQDQPDGGNGWLRILIFQPVTDTIHVSTYSPWLKQYQLDSNSDFIIPYQLNGSIPFTVVALPDTQYYSSMHPEIFLNQTKWVIANQEALNIKYVTHLGDIVDAYSNLEQWQNSKTAMSLLTAFNIPYSMCVGNHDAELNNIKKLSLYYFFYNPNEVQTTGSFENDNYNSYTLINVEGNNLMFMNLQFSPPATALTWANQIVTENPDYTVILSTHDYLDPIGFRDTVGENIFKTLVEPHADQIKLVLCGHYSAESSRVGSIFAGKHENMRTDTVRLP